MFAILFMNLFKGSLNFCFKKDLDPYGINKKNCEKLGGNWILYDTNFENYFNSMVSLFVISSPGNWPN